MSNLLGWLALIVGVISVIVTITVPEIRCSVGLECSEKTSASDKSNSTSKGSNSTSSESYPVPYNPTPYNSENDPKQSRRESIEARLKDIKQQRLATSNEISRLDKQISSIADSFDFTVTDERWSTEVRPRIDPLINQKKSLESHNERLKEQEDALAKELEYN